MFPPQGLIIGELWSPKGEIKVLIQKEAILNDVQAERAPAARDLLKICRGLSQSWRCQAVQDWIWRVENQDVYLLFSYLFFCPLSSNFLYLHYILAIACMSPQHFHGLIQSLGISFSISRGGNSLVNLRTRPQATGHWPDLQMYLPEAWVLS